MKNMDQETLTGLKNINQPKEKDDEKISRFIIPPNNVWNLYRNNISQLIAIIYIFVAPYIIVSNRYIS